LHGIIPPLCTPLTAGLDVDVASLERLIDHLLDAGVHGLFVLGSTGETAFLPDRSRHQVLQVAIARVAGQVPVLAGCIDMTTLRVLDQAEDALKAGADGIVATAPFYTRTHPAEIDAHFRRIGDGIGLPVYAYDLPVSVHTKLGTALLQDLARDGVIAGVKDSSSDDSGLRALILATRGRPDFSVLTGSELTVDAALWMHAAGAVPGLANVDPVGYVRLYRAAAAGDWTAAAAEQNRLAELFEIVHAGDPGRMGGSSAGVGAFKTALHLRGIIDCPITAPPQIPLNDTEIARIADTLHRVGP
jgi:4-hydroxy-tetrahydrodipicolinate synthase